MYKSKQAKNWIEEAGWLLNSQWCKKTYTKKVSIYIKLYTFHRSDIDGVLKVLLDLLQEMRVIENDNQIYLLHIEKFLIKHRSEECILFEISDYS